MSPDALKKLMHAEPFAPFVLHTSDGREIEVPHPDFISISRAGRTAVVHTGEDDFDVVDVFLIATASTRKHVARKPTR